RERIRSKKRKRAAAAAMLVCLALIVIGLVVGAVQAIIYSINSSGVPLAEGETQSASAAETPLSDIAAGPFRSDAEAISSPVIPYDYSSPVPAIPAVQDSYFADALLLGDSRFTGFGAYMSAGEVLSSSYLTVSNALERECSFGEETATLASRLAARQFGSVYINCGLNELGWEYSSAFIEAYGELVSAVRAAQPEADIYLGGLWHLSAETAAATSYHSDARIDEYNALILSLASSEGCYFLDFGEIFEDASGAQLEDVTTNGINPTEGQFNTMYEYLKTHTVSKEYYGN
ncbi:MAG: SGNH/GDSL hydrolase family protein, partial [Oscillospiraceae bacterium]|nr:SGNH/GDSL hydrolase family protein [Oscillospiraceae bacterium]